MPGSNYFIRVEIDDTSIINAQNKLRGLGNFAKTSFATIPTGPAGAIGRATTGGIESAQRQATIAATAQSTLSSSMEKTTASVSKQRNAFAQATLDNERFAGTMLNATQATNDFGILTSRNVRDLARGQRTIRQTSQDVGLVALKLAQWTAAAASIGAIVGVFSRMATEIANVNDAMIGLQRVTSDTFDRDIASSAIVKTIRDLNVSAEDASVAAFEMGKAYQNMNEALAASRTILLANKVAEIDLAQASQQLVQVSNAYNLTGFQQERILDALNSQQNTLGVNISKTLEAIARSSAVTQQASGSLDNLVARTAIGIRFTGFAPETVSRAQARLAQQILSTKGQAGIIAALETTLPGRTILEQIVAPDDPTRLQNDVDKVFNTIGRNFQTLSSQQKNAVAESLASGRQGGLSVILGATLENFALVEKQANISATSQGSALKELEDVLSSVRERVGTVGAEFAILAANIENSGILAVFVGLVSVLQNVLKLANSLFEVFNSLPEGIRVTASALAGIVAPIALLGKIFPGFINSAFSSSSRASGIRASDQGLAQAKVAQSAEAKIATTRAASLTSAQRVEAQIIAQREAAEARIAATRAGSLASPLTSSSPARRSLASTDLAGPQARMAKAADGAALSLNRLASSSNLAAAAEGQGAITPKPGGISDRLASPGAFLIGSVLTSVLGSALQQTKPPGETSITGNALSGLGIGLTAGAFTGNIPLAVGLGVGGGLAGALQGVNERNKQLDEILKTNTRAINDVTDALDDAARKSEDRVADVDFPDPKEIDASEAVKGYVDEQNKFLEGISDSVARYESLGGGVRGFSVAGDLQTSTGIDADRLKDILGVDEFDKLIDRLSKENLLTATESDILNIARPGKSEFEGLGRDESRRRDELLVQAIEATRGRAKSDREALIALTSEDERRRLDTLRLLSSTDVGDQPQRRLVAGDLENIAKGIADDFNAGNLERVENLISRLDENDALFSILGQSIGPEGLKAVERIRKSGKANESDLRTVAQGFANVSSELIAIQADARKLSVSIAATGLTDPSLDPGAIEEAYDAAFENLSDSITESTNAYKVGIISSSRFNRNLTELSNRAVELLRSSDPAERSEGAAAILELQQAREEALNNQLDFIQREQDLGIRGDDQAILAKARAVAAFLQKAEVRPGSEAQKNAILKLTEIAREQADLRVEAIRSQYEPLIAAATSDAEKAALISQATAEAQAASQVSIASLGISRDALQIAATGTSQTLENQKQAYASFAIASLESAKTVAGKAQTFGSEFVSNILPDFIESAALIQVGKGILDSVNSFIGGAVDNLIGLLRGSKGKSKRRGRGLGAQTDKFLKEINDNFAATIEDSFSDLGSSLGGQEIDTSGAEDAARAAAELLSARFELLKAIARGDDIKVARIALQQAKAEAAQAKTQAEKISAQAGIINAEKDLRETILQEKTSQLDFLFQTEQITAGEYVRRLQGLVKLTKGNKDAFRQLKLKIRGLLKQEQNDKTFGLPTEIPLPSIFEIKKIIGVGKQVAAAQVAASQVGTKGGLVNKQPAGVNVTNQNQITIVVRNPSDVEAVRKEVSKATGATMKKNRYMGSNPGFV